MTFKKKKQTHYSKLEDTDLTGLITIRITQKRKHQLQQLPNMSKTVREMIEYCYTVPRWLKELEQ
jgi:hypothetical protein